MRFRLRLFGLAALGVFALAAATPAHAIPSDSEDVSVHSQLESLAETAGQATARALDESNQAVTEIESMLAPRLKTFANMLNEQKARLATIGEDAAANFETWWQATEQSWSDIQRSVDDALDLFRDWIGPPSVPDQQAEIPV